MARYLSGILWSMFNQVTGCRTFKKNTELVDALEHYQQQGHLRETTHFVTFNINDICTKFAHDIAIKALDKFLCAHRSELETVVEGLTNETIIQLVHLVLRNQFFIYENKLYQQIHGTASGSLLTRPLACIYLFFGQSSAFVDSLVKNRHQLLTR